jgi:hypothetical protein
MPSRSSKDHDFTAVARRVVEQAIGEQMDGSPLPPKFQKADRLRVIVGLFTAKDDELVSDRVFKHVETHVCEFERLYVPAPLNDGAPFHRR